MKISAPTDISPAAAQNGGAAPAKATEAAQPAERSERKTPGVDVTVSAQARKLDQARVDDASEVDMKKVEAMRDAIKRHNYSVNQEAIADKLLANARELLERTRS